MAISWTNGSRVNGTNWVRAIHFTEIVNRINKLRRLEFLGPDSTLPTFVGDTGVGIADDQRTAIFEEYVQGRHRWSPSGMGLGLAIVQRLAGLLGHGLALQSVPGRGSMFSVIVPQVARVPEVTFSADGG